MSVVQTYKQHNTPRASTLGAALLLSFMSFMMLGEAETKKEVFRLFQFNFIYLAGVILAAIILFVSFARWNENVSLHASTLSLIAMTPITLVWQKYTLNLDFGSSKFIWAFAISIFGPSIVIIALHKFLYHHSE